jgi:hypothetical protein
LDCTLREAQPCSAQHSGRHRCNSISTNLRGNAHTSTRASIQQLCTRIGSQQLWLVVAVDLVVVGGWLRSAHGGQLNHVRHSTQVDSQGTNHWSYAQGVIYASIQQNLQPQIEPAMVRKQHTHITLAGVQTSCLAYCLVTLSARKRCCCCCCSYVTLRLLGQGADTKPVTAARNWVSWVTGAHLRACTTCAARYLFQHRN